jgi:transposase InsO family protein
MAEAFAPAALPTSSAKFSVQPPVFKGDDGQSFINWITQFERFLRISRPADQDKLDLLLLYCGDKGARYYNEIAWPTLSADDLQSGISEYSRAVSFLRSKFVTTKNVLSERIKLSKTRQKPGQSLADYVSDLRTVVAYCDYPTNFEDEALRDAFVSGLCSDSITQAVCRSFATAAKTGRPFSLADAIQSVEIEMQAQDAASPHISVNNTVASFGKSRARGGYRGRGGRSAGAPAAAVSDPPKSRCYWCGGAVVHGKAACPARAAKCNSCGTIGHFEKACHKKQSSAPPGSKFVAAGDSSLCRRYLSCTVNDSHRQSFLLDSGSDITVVSQGAAARLNLSLDTTADCVVNNISNSSLRICGRATVKMSLDDGRSFSTDIFVAESLCDDAILGISALSNFDSVTISLGGSLGPLHVAASFNPVSDFPTVFDKDLSKPLKCEPVPIITLRPGTEPVRCPSRHYDDVERKFISLMIEKWQNDNIIVRSQSPWRSQVVVVKDSGTPKRLAIDYASTINPATIANAYPFPLIPDLLTKLSAFRVFSVVDCKSAYHQLALLDAEMPLTAFEACGKLWEFRRLPYGPCNGVPAFQSVMDRLLDGLSGCVSYVDDIVIGGFDDVSHNSNLLGFLSRAADLGLKLSPEKCHFGQRRLVFCGHVLEGGELKPDPARLQPLLDYPLPATPAELDRFVGLAVYYSKWIRDFASVTAPLFDAKNNKTFPLSDLAADAVTVVKKAVAGAALAVPAADARLILETDASLGCVSGVLSTADRQPVAFVSHRLSPAEKNWAAIELEAFAIVVCCNKLRHFLVGRHFEIVTDQEGVSFLFDSRPRSRVKNAKLCRWRIDLSDLSYTISYRPGPLNVVADAMSRVAAFSVGVDDLSDATKAELVESAHRKLGHPGIKRTLSFLQRFYQWEGMASQVGDFVRSCHLCATEKPRFFKPPPTHLIRSVRPFERLAIDFVGPKTGEFPYLFTVVDEFSRFPFGFALRDMTTSSAIDCLHNLFTIFGAPLFIHSDRGSQFESAEFSQFLSQWNVVRTRTTPYNPAGNGQCERFNGILWCTIVLRCRENAVSLSRWHTQLPMALCNIRALPCRALEFSSPHDAFFSFPRHSTFAPFQPNVPCAEVDEARVARVLDQLPPWLRVGSRVLLKKHPRLHKADPLVEPVLVLSIHSVYFVTVRFQSGREDTVSTKYLARLPPDEDIVSETAVHVDEDIVPPISVELHSFRPDADVPPVNVEPDVVRVVLPVPVRRGRRRRKANPRYVF